MSTPQKIAIVNYGMGNIHTVYKKIQQTNSAPTIVSTAEELLNADKIVLPGVGHFAKAMENLQRNGLLDALNDLVLHKKKPVLGICLGMQLMSKFSEEGDVEGLGWIDAKVMRFQIKDQLTHKIPQTGWNSIQKHGDSPLLKKIDDNAEFYFLHSYHYHAPSYTNVIASTVFEYEYISAVQKENIFGTQFHPEKSHDTGLQLLNNFIAL
ncbi:imidazole glycerol phosphate synthase subunit HisH [Terrimonas rubra]|uniref:Imidazole glycerol phosphate synthase subunit HisH n=1 Tax=Terrimonas rubra TaxID=1035890 RepID=A0ABW6A2B8_9BACT